MYYKKTYNRYVRRPYRQYNKGYTQGYRRRQNYSVAKLAKDVGRVKGMLNVEYKSKDMDLANSPGINGNYVLLNGLQKGDDINNRDGRQVRFKSIQYAFQTEIASAQTTPQLLRWIIFIDKQPNAAGPGLIGNIYDDPIDGFRNLNNRRRFVVLKTGLINLLPADSDYQQPKRKGYKKIDMRTIYDDSDNGDITDITSNSLYMWFGTDAGTAPSVTGKARLRFIDN